MKSFLRGIWQIFICDIFFWQGLSDEIHTVVKQSLISLEKILLVLLDHRTDWFYEDDICIQPNSSDLDDLPIEYKCITSPIQLLEDILDQLPLVFENKYWVIQNKYCHFIATMNYDALEKVLGQDKELVYKVSNRSRIKYHSNH